MAGLSNLRDSFVLIGNVMINKDPSKYVKTEASGKGGWMKKTINLGVKVSNSNKIYVNQEIGFWSDEIIEKTQNETGTFANGKPKKKENWIYNGEMKVDPNTGKKVYVADNIPFNQRFNPDMISKVSYNKKMRVTLEQDTMGVNDEHGNIVSIPKVDDKGNPVYIEKEFIFVGDAIDYIKTHLKHDQRVYIYGSSEISQYVGKDNLVKTRIDKRINTIRVAREDEANEASGITNFYFEKEGFDKSDFKNSKKYLIQGFRTYQNEDKKIVPVPINYVLDFSNPNTDWENEDTKAQVDYLVDVFESTKRDKIYVTQWRYLIFEGNEEVELTEKDLSKDLKMRVKLKLIPLEEAIRQMRGKAISDKVKEIKLVMPLGQESIVEVEDLTSDDLIPPPIVNKAEAVKAVANEEKVAQQQEVKATITAKFDSMFQS